MYKTLSMVANHQIRHQTTCNMGCQSGDCRCEHAEKHEVYWCFLYFPSYTCFGPIYISWLICHWGGLVICLHTQTYNTLYTWNLGLQSHLVLSRCHKASRCTAYSVFTTLNTLLPCSKHSPQTQLRHFHFLWKIIKSISTCPPPPPLPPPNL